MQLAREEILVFVPVCGTTILRATAAGLVPVCGIGFYQAFLHLAALVSSIVWNIRFADYLVQILSWLLASHCVTICYSCSRVRGRVLSPIFVFLLVFDVRGIVFNYGCK